MFTEIGFLCDINLVVKKIILIDLHDKLTMSETFDVPAGYCDCDFVLKDTILLSL